MKITAENSVILNEVYEGLEDKGFEVEKETINVDGVKGDVTLYLSIGNFVIASFGTFITYLRYLETQKNHYIHYRYKDDAEEETRELKFDNLSKKELDEKLKNIQDNFDNLELIHIG